MGAAQSALPVDGSEDPRRSKRSEALDSLGGWERPPIRRGDSMDAQCQWLQGGLALMGERVKDVLVQETDQGRMQMTIETIKALRTKIQQQKFASRDQWGTSKELWELEDRLYAEQQTLLQLREAQADVETQRDHRNENPDFKATDFISGRTVDNRRQRKVRESEDGTESEASDDSLTSQSTLRTSRASRISQKPSPVGGASLRRKMLVKGTGGAGLGPGAYSAHSGLEKQAQDIISGSPAHSRREIQKRRKPAAAEVEDKPGRVGFFCPGGGYLNPNVILLVGRHSDVMLNPKSPGYYGFPSKTPQWRVNVARAKRKAIMTLYIVSAFRKAGQTWRQRDGFNQRDRLDRMGSLGVFVPLVLDELTDRFIEQQQQFTEQLEAEAKEQEEAKNKQPSIMAKQESPDASLEVDSDSSDNKQEAGAKLWPSKPPGQPPRIAIPSGSSPSLPGVNSPPSATSPSSRSPQPGTSPSGRSLLARAVDAKEGRQRSLSPKSTSPTQSSGFPLRPTTVHGTNRPPISQRRPSESILATPRSLSSRNGRGSQRRGSEADVPPLLPTQRRLSSGGVRSTTIANRLTTPDGKRRSLQGGSDKDLRSRGLLHNSPRSTSEKSLEEQVRASGRSGIVSQRATREKLIKAGVSITGGPSNRNNMSRLVHESHEPVPKAFAPNRQVKSDDDLEKAKQMMASYVNRANSRWTDELKWDTPQLFHVGQFEKLGGLDFQAYKSEIEQMLLKGQLAVQIHAAEQTIEMADGSEQLLYLADSWAVMDELVPFKVPNGERFEGLSFGGRQLLQLLVAVENIAGRQGGYCIPVIIHVPEHHIAAVAQELHECKYFGFNRDRILLLAQPTNQGYFFDENEEHFKKAPMSLKRANGSGYSMKQLMWNYEATRLKEDGTREVVRKSVMNWLKDLGVEWLHSFQIDDFQRFSSDVALDMGALALTMKMHKSNDWQMSIQAVETVDLNAARTHGGIVLCTEGEDEVHVDHNASKSIQVALDSNTHTISGGARKPRNAVAKQVKTLDMASPKWSVILEQLKRKNGGKYIMPANRYIFNLHTLDKILMRKETFHTSLQLEGCYVYPHLHMSDITTAPDARCVALTPKRALSDTNLAAGPLEWCEAALSYMKEQDNQMAIRKAIGKYTSDKIALRKKVMDISNLDKPVKGRNIVLFVTDNKPSRIAFQFIIGMLAGATTPADTLHIMCSVNTQGRLEAAKEMMKTFDDPMLRFMTVKKDVEVRGIDTLTEQMYKYTEERHADLVVIGSDIQRETASTAEILQQSSAGGTSSLGSVTLTAVKHLLRPVLIVKSTKRCTISRQNGVSENLRVVLQVEPTVQTTVRYLGGWLGGAARQNHVLLAKPNGVDKEGFENMSTRMMLTHFADVVHKHKLTVGKRPLEGAFQVCLPDLAHRERAHIIAVQAPRTRNMSHEMREMIRSSPCAILINKTKEATPIELLE